MEHQKNLLFVGDSLTRYQVRVLPRSGSLAVYGAHVACARRGATRCLQYLNLEYFLSSGYWPHPTGRVPNAPDLANEHEWRSRGSWNQVRRAPGRMCGPGNTGGLTCAVGST